MTKWTKIADEKPPEGQPVLLYMPEAKLASRYPYTIGCFISIKMRDGSGEQFFIYCDTLLNDIEGQLMHQPTHWAAFEPLKGPHNAL